MTTKQPISLRLRLSQQTMMVAGVVVTGFGAGAWWFAREQQARNYDLLIAHQARLLWAQLIPRDREKQIAEAVQKNPSKSENLLAVTVIWHSDGNPLATFSGPMLNAVNRSIFISHLPEGAEVIRSGFGAESLPRQARAVMLGTKINSTPRRPVMQEIRIPDFFTIQDATVKWRFGAFSNPHYTLYVGLSENALQSEVRSTALWFAVGAVIALFVSGLGAWWSSGRAIRPLNRIVALADRMSAGNLSERISHLGSDDREFVQLIGALNNMTARLERSFEQSSRFTADASHELKTPLAVIQNTLNEVLRTETLDDETHQRISVVLHQMSRLKHITRSLLILSQADAGELPIRRERYDLSEDLEGLMDDAESLCESAGLEFQKEIESNIFIEADRALMHQVFQNLLSNAVRHNQKNGSVHVRLRHEAEGARFEIHNACAEISEEVKLRLFERFYRTEDSRSSEGFGLGLNIASELTRANGGMLELLPTKIGTICFSVTFPYPETTKE
jgi:two-component system, OmpR family, heavy metal sensor histidine kinase CusS